MFGQGDLRDDILHFIFVLHVGLLAVFVQRHGPKKREASCRDFYSRAVPLISPGKRISESSLAQPGYLTTEYRQGDSSDNGKALSKHTPNLESKGISFSCCGICEPGSVRLAVLKAVISRDRVSLNQERVGFGHPSSRILLTVSCLPLRSCARIQVYIQPSRRYLASGQDQQVNRTQTLAAWIDSAKLASLAYQHDQDQSTGSCIWWYQQRHLYWATGRSGHIQTR